MGVDVVHQDVIHGKAGFLRNHGTHGVGQGRGDFHEVVADDAHLLCAVAQHKAMGEKMLVYAVVEFASGSEAREHGMLVFRRGNICGAIAHSQPFRA